MRERIIITFVAILTILVISGGCKVMNDNEMKAAAEKAMADKYGESFKAIEAEAIDRDSSYVWLRPDRIPAAVVKAAVNKDGTGLSDNYITVKLCHETSEKVEWDLRHYTGDYYVHTDNSLEYTSADDKSITAAEYVSDNPADYFVVSVIINAGNADMNALCEELIKAANALDLNRGYIDVYKLNSDEYTRIQNDIARYDNMSSSEVKYTLDDAGGPQISMDLSVKYTNSAEIMRGTENE